MAIVGIGSDLIKINRFDATLKRFGERALERFLHPEEINTFKRLKTRQSAFLAKRFAAKEAFAKALGLGFRQGLQWKDLNIIKDEIGKPSLECYGTAKSLLAQLHIQHIWLTITDTKEYASAFVVLEK